MLAALGVNSSKGTWLDVERIALRRESMSKSNRRVIGCIHTFGSRVQGKAHGSEDTCTTREW